MESNSIAASRSLSQRLPLKLLHRIGGWQRIRGKSGERTLYCFASCKQRGLRGEGELAKDLQTGEASE